MMVTTPSRYRLAMPLALGTAYILWGSTYLAIGETVDTVPPFRATAARFLGAAVLLLPWVLLRGGAAHMRTVGWLPARNAAIVGLLRTGPGSPVSLADCTQATSPRARWSLAYLIVFGSIVALTAFTWLLRNAAVSTVATYAYVNPVVALLLGWWIRSEHVTMSTLIASAIIVGSVALTVRAETGDAVGGRAVMPPRSGAEPAP